MSRQIKARPMRNHAQYIGLREIMLAGFGAASLARKQALKTLDQLAVLAADLPDQSEALRERVSETSQSLLDHAIVAADDLRIQAMHWATQAGKEIQSRAKPVLADFGFKRGRTSYQRATVRKTTRKSAGKKTPAKSHVKQFA